MPTIAIPQSIFDEVDPLVISSTSISLDDSFTFASTTDTATLGVSAGQPAVLLELTEGEHQHGNVIRFTQDTGREIDRVLQDVASQTSIDLISARLAVINLSSTSSDKAVEPEAGTLVLTRDVDYTPASPSGPIELLVAGAGLSGASFSFEVIDRDGDSVISKTPLLIDAGTEQQRLQVSIAKVDTAGLRLGALYEYFWVVDLANGERWRPESGTLDLQGDWRT